MTGLKFKSLEGAGKPKSKPTPKTSTFVVRQGTTAVCKWMADGDVVAGQLFHALLELWVDTKSKVKRKRDGIVRDWLFLSSADLQTLSGLTERQISDRAVPILRKRPFFIIVKGRLTPNHVNQYQIHFDQSALWEEIRGMLNPTSEMKEKMDGHTWIKKQVDRRLLPYLFKRLYDTVNEAG